MVSSAVIENEDNTFYKAVYKGSMLAGQIAPGLVIMVCTGGLGAMSALGTGLMAVTYGANSAGQTYSTSMNEGYTWSQSALNATADFTEETAKMVAFSKAAEFIGPASECVSKTELLQNALKLAGVSAAVEEVDGEVISPFTEAVSLNDEEKLEVDHLEVVKEAGIAAAVAGGGSDESDFISLHSRKHMYNAEKVSTSKKTQYGKDVNVGKLCADTIQYPDEIIYNEEQKVIVYKKSYCFNISTEDTPTGTHRVFIPLNTFGNKTIRMTQFPLYGGN